MKNCRIYLITQLLLLFVAMGSYAQGVIYDKSHPLVIGLDLDYAPLEYIDNSGMPSGLDVELTRELMRRMDIVFTYQPNTWTNVKNDIYEGMVDLGMMVYSSSRVPDLSFSRAVLRQYYQMVYRKADKRKIDVRNLKGLNVAYMSSQPVREMLEREEAVQTIVTDMPKTLKELNEGRYDAVICYRYQFAYNMENSKLKNLEAYDLALAPREYCFVSRNKALIDSINVYLREMEEEGFIREVYGDVYTHIGTNQIPNWVFMLITFIVCSFSAVFFIILHMNHKQLRQQMERAVRSERHKTVFLGNVSHALRTPLNSIIGFSELLSELKTNDLSVEERKHMLRLINQNGHQLLYFINELLQLSILETSDAELHIDEVNMDQEMEACAKFVEPRLAEGVVFKIDGNKGTAYFDEKKMKLVLEHLLDNAAKNTTEGYICVRHKLEKNGLRIEVEDTGCGLPENLRDNIFSLLSDKNTFIRSETPGLGLSICRAVIDQCGGKIGVESATEHGTVFWIWIPDMKSLYLKNVAKSTAKNETESI